MLKNLKKMLAVIPFMVFGLFLFTGFKAMASDAVLLESKKIVVGEANKENTYYFTNNTSLEFKVTNYDPVWKYDTALKYRVIRPDGKATDWSESVRYINTNGKFTIPDISKLNYSETVDVTSRNSVAKAATYYIDIKYYAEYFYIPFDQKKPETIKVVVKSFESEDYNIPTITINEDGGNYLVNASTVKGDKAYSVINGVSYYFANDDMEEPTNPYDFNKNKEMCKDEGAFGDLEFKKDNSVDVVIEGVEGEYKYLYVLTETGNDYFKIERFNLVKSEVDTEVSTPVTPEVNPNTNTGLFDYRFGELILLVLVVVLIVSCALIITQKIVDYKKRLY